MRLFYRGLIGAALLLFTAGALSIPFVYESTTLWYKVGIDRIMLRGGQLVGMVTLVLLFVQLLLAARGRFLIDVFGLAAVMRYHRANGLLIVFAAFFHVTLVLAPEGLANLPIGWKFWPEMVGGGLFFLLVFMAVSSHYREKLRLKYTIWRSIHKVVGYLAPLLVVVHVLFVSDSFERVLPKTALLETLATGIALILLSKKRG